MKILVAYSTNSGSSFEVGELITQILGKKHEVSLREAHDVTANSFAGYQGVILGSGSWNSDGSEGMPQPTMLKLLESMKTKKFTQWFAVYGCGDNSYTKFCGAVDFIENVLKETRSEQLAQSLRIDSFFFDLKRNVKEVTGWAEHLLKKIG